MNDIMTLEEVATYLRLSERTVIDWAQKGELPGGKLGTSWRFKRSEIENWVNQKITPRIKFNDGTELSLNSMLSKDRLIILNSDNKDNALNKMIDLCTTIPGIKSRQELADTIFKREQLMSTGIGLSIAVPHARLNSVNNVYVALGVSSEDIVDYESLDGMPVRIIIMIIAGRDQHTQYIQTLSRLSQVLKNDIIREQILYAKTIDELYEILIEEDDDQ